MIRIDSRFEYDPVAIDTACRIAGVRPSFRIAYCEHGRAYEQVCVQCENGYLDDCHTFANLPGWMIQPGTWGTEIAPEAIAQVTDDGHNVIYVPRAHAKKVKAILDRPECLYCDGTGKRRSAHAGEAACSSCDGTGKNRPKR